MGNLAGHALEANIGGVDALEANIVGVSMLRGADGITPTIGENGNWYLGETDTGKPSRGEAGPQGLPGVYYGTTPPTGDTHPVWIDPDGDHDDGGLLPAVTSADNGKVLRVVSSAWAADDMPTGGTDMGITGAEVGQIAKITAVDESGVPTAWSPVGIPTTLPNPNALTFTGAVTGSYDGSAPLEVNIPQGGGGAWHTIGTQKMDGVETAVSFDLDGETIIQIIVTANWGAALTATEATVSLTFANGETVQFTPQTMNATSYAPKNIFTIFGNSKHCRQMIFSKAEGALYNQVQGSFGIAYGYDYGSENMVEDGIATGITITFDKAPPNAAIVKVEGM